ncbi:DsbA family protein [Aldersonia sp. NBC_00410]|uniref:DsbA family protein n=1 Tax=Aldersonia sp. NBC_00410 TaxID=2975954 RepID=UPI0022552F0E|nr:DsbA family protein [Aldersonia sp. NBC_00410]MCX5044701.1 DsbA family protein [Aldersonia sp. NBC_00410]
MSQKPTRSKNLPQPKSDRSTYLLGGLAIVVVAVIVIGGVIWQSNRTETRNEGYGSVQNSDVTATLEDSGAVLLGLPGAAKTIDLFEDPMCPYCAQLEETHGQEVAQAIDDGKLAVRYHLLNFLNRLSASGDYSTRAVAASQCVAQTGDGPAYSAFHAALFSPEGQPKENGSSDHSNDDLATMAKDAGANDDAQQCIKDGTNVQSAAEAATAGQQAMNDLGANGTPAVFDGTDAVETNDPGWVAALIQ